MAAFQMGIEGCCAKGSSILDLVNCIRQVAAGETSWTAEILKQLNFAPPTSRSSWQDRLRSSSLEQIEATLTELDAKLREAKLSALDRSILTGRKRELNTARWLVKRLLPPTASVGLQSTRSSPPPPAAPNADRLIPASPAEISLIERQPSIFDRIASKLQSSLENLTPTL